MPNKYHANFDQLDFFSLVKIILIPDQEFLPSVDDYIKQSFENEVHIGQCITLTMNI